MIQNRNLLTHPVLLTTVIMLGRVPAAVADETRILSALCTILPLAGAKLIWCTTTPVPNDNKSTYARRKGASAEFNAAALDVIRRHPDILVSDLHGLIDRSPIFDNWRKQNDAHFYQKKEQQILGEAVAITIRKALEKQSSRGP